jgi:dTMP kinase
MINPSQETAAGRGLFITFEGIDGAGKTTQIQYAADHMRKAGRKVVSTREPGGTAAGEAIRNLVLDKTLRWVPDAELLLIFAARAQHVAQVIEPALSTGKDVICDRFTDASYAYQGGGRGIAAARIKALADWTHPGLTPDLTLLFDTSPDIGQERTGMRGFQNRFDEEQHRFHVAVREAYLALAAAHPGRIQIVDAAQHLDEVRKQVLEHIDKLLI